MDTVDIEFFVEPFNEGSPGRHVEAAIAAFNDLGIATEVGPFATTASGDVERTAQAVANMVRDALAAGASRIAVQLERRPDEEAGAAVVEAGDAAGAAAGSTSTADAAGATAGAASGSTSAADAAGAAAGAAAGSTSAADAADAAAAPREQA